MAKIEGMALNVVLALTKKEIMDYCMTTRVGVVSVGFDYDVIESDKDGSRKLIYIAPFVKHGYHRQARIENEKE